MEETKEQLQPPVEEPQIPEETLGNKVPNTFEELNTMRQEENLPPENFAKTQSTFSKNGNTIMQSHSNTQYKPREDPLIRYANSMNLPKDTSIVKMPQKVENEKYEIPPSEYIWNAPYLKKTQIFPSYAIAPDHPTQQMLKEFSTKLRERSCGEQEYTKTVDVKDFVKYDRDNLWRTSNEVMNQYIPPIERGVNDSSTGLKTTISPIQAKHDKEAENHIYFDPLKKYAQTAEDEGNHIERNPLDNHKLKHNNYFPMSRLVGSFWDKVDKESYFRNRYDKLSFDPTERDSGYSTNLMDHIEFNAFYDKNVDNGTTHPREDYKQTEYRNTFWRNKGFPFKDGPKPIAHTAATLNIEHFN